LEPPEALGVNAFVAVEAEGNLGDGRVFIGKA
jgi:hypothetical protein